MTLSSDQLIAYLQETHPADAKAREFYVQLSQASAAEQGCAMEDAPTIRSAIEKIAQQESTWALLLASQLWRYSCQTITDFENHRQLAQFAGSSKKFSKIPIEEHWALARELIQKYPNPALYIILGNASRYLHQYAEAENAYLEGIHRYPDDPFLKLRLANLYLATYRIEQAHRLLRILQADYSYAREMLFIAPANQQAQISVESLPDLTAPGAQMVWLVAADPAYIEKYALRWASSVQKHAGQGLHLHLHVIAERNNELSKTTRHQLQAIAGLTMTERMVDLSGASANQRKALYSSERYLFLAEMLRKYAVPMVVSDIDVECVKDPRELLTRMGESDLGYTHFRNTIEAWERYAATALIIKPTQASMNFFRKMADLLVTAINTHPQPWFIDQIALFRLIEEFPTGLRTAYLEHILTESNPPSKTGYFKILHASWCTEERVGAS